MSLDSKDLTRFQSPGRIHNATNSAMKRWNTVIGKVRNGLPNRRVTSNMAAEIKDAASSCKIQQGASFKLRQQIESEVQQDSEPKPQQESPNHGESPKLEPTREQLYELEIRRAQITLVCDAFSPSKTYSQHSLSFLASRRR
jgi:hypothetical protein